ncbi:MAG: DUF1707 domain-containing protein [Propionibacteriaceae bacterium]|jgi:hypothetical protein|nr:DUF1707 domain-containing protein [Propionibacteriaceae bacterium]
MSIANLEPTDVGPAVGGDLAVTAADRDLVVSLLNSAYGEGHLQIGDRNARIAAAQRAEIFDDLIPLTRDLTPGVPPKNFALPSQSFPQVPLAAGQPAPVATSGQFQNENGTDQIVAIFSGATRSGVWNVKPSTSVAAVFGGVDLDMSEAVFTANPIEINVNCLFGGVDLIVPVGAEVRSTVWAVFGGVEEKKLASPVPGAPVILISGFALFGGVGVKHPKGWRKFIR